MGEASHTTRARALQWARQSIDRLDARLLLEFVAGCSAAQLIAYPDTDLSPEVWTQYQLLVARRQVGEPLAYLVGTAGFYGDMLHVTPAVLVPRPETEELVSWALQLLQGRSMPRVVDAGTGSGAIALALAGARPDARIVAIDISPAALDIATLNRDRLDRKNVEMRCASWLAGWDAADLLDLVISNPPYIPANDPHLAGDGVSFEPALALTDGADGLSPYRILAQEAFTHLQPGGWLLVEHGHDQAAAVADLWRQAGFVAVESRFDLSGNPRMTCGQKPDALAPR